jgi:hypothetical protein
MYPTERRRDVIRVPVLQQAFDDQWYARAYPLDVEEVGARDAAALEQHYRRYGRFRGYLPYAEAERPKNAAAHCLAR